MPILLRRLLALLAAAIPATALAQTSGTIATQTNSPWTTAPWVITSGLGTFPDGGGVAMWNPVIAATPGTLGASATLTLNQPITLSGINYNSPYSLTLAGTAVNNLALSATGGTLDVSLGVTNSPSASFTSFNSLNAPITGGGTAGLTKTGSGTLTLAPTVASTYTGGTHINGGILILAGTQGDAALGATGAGNGLSLNGGTLFVTTTALTTSRTVTLNAGGGSFTLNANATFNGVISGAGSLTNTGFGAFTMTLTAANTYTGATVNSSAITSTITLSGNGSIATSASYDFAGTVNLSNTTTNVTNRLNDAAAMTLRGATLTINGNAAAATSEAIGAVTLQSGTSVITITPNAAQTTTLSAASITRSNNATLFARGTALGAATAANVAQLTSTIAPTLVGGGGAPGSTTISVLPWAFGNVGAASTLGSSLVTYGANGIRPLTTAEYSSTLGANATDNVRLTGSTVAPATSTVNGLVFAPAAAGGTLSGGTISVTSGAVLSSPTATLTAGATISANLDFGTAEGVIHSTQSVALSGVLSGSGGLTTNAFNGSAIVLGSANTYTGPTTITAGFTVFAGNISNDGTPSAFGTGTSAASPLILNGGTATARLYADSVTTTATVNRDLIVQAGGPAVVSFGTNGDSTLIMNGSIALGRRLSLEGGGTAATPLILNGNITGPGLLTDAFASVNVLNGNNSFSGGINVQTGTYAAGSDTAFGTGTIFFSNVGFVQSADASPRTLVNNIIPLTTPTFQGTGALTFTGTLNLNGSRTIAVTSTAAAGVVFTGNVFNGGLNKIGAGVLSLNSLNGNTYTGGTLLAANMGTLNVNNKFGSGTGSGAVSIGGTTAADRSTLSGSFIISGATAISGALQPGNGGVGTADFGSSLTYTANALTTMELGSSSSADKITAAGALNLGGSTFAVVTIGGYQAVAGDSFDLIDWGTITGTATLDFTNATLADPVNTMWDSSNFLLNGVITVIPVPEPMLLLAAAGLVLAARRRLR